MVACRIWVCQTAWRVFLLSIQVLALVGRSFESNNRDFAWRFLLIPPVRRKDLHCFLKGFFPLRAGENPGCRLKFLVTHLYRYIGMSQHIVVPLRMFYRTALGSYR